MTSNLPSLPAGWELTAWLNIVTIKNGKDYKAVLNKNGKYPIYGSGGIMNYSDEYLCNENSVVIGRKGTINNPLFVTEKFWNIDTAFGIEAKAEILEAKFLYYFCLSYDFLQLNTSTTLPSLTKSNLQTIEMPLPPLEEQKRLVSLLDTLFAKIDRSIELLSENITAADALLPSALNTVFEELGHKYTKVSLSQHIEFNGGSQPPKNQFSDTKLDGYVRLIQIRDYKSDAYKIYVKKAAVRKFCTKDDIMIGRYGPPVFQILRGIDGAYNVALMKADINESFFTKDYVFYFLQNPSIQNYIIGLSQRSAGQSGVNKEALEKYEIPLPPLDIQTQTVAYLDSIRTKVETLKHVQNDKIANLNALKASILDRAFKGEL